MYVKKAEFIISVADKSKMLAHSLPEIAIAGKSNVGKSSFINTFTGRNKLARTSSEPGRTRLLNYFKINDELMLVDLPGYGFARVSDKEKKNWADLIDGYLLNSQNLINVFVLLDVRHDAGEHDKALVNFLYHHNIPFTIIATKGDKLSKAQREKRKGELAHSVGVGREDVIITSSLDALGREDVEKKIKNLLDSIQDQSID